MWHVRYSGLDDVAHVPSVLVVPTELLQILQIL